MQFDQLNLRYLLPESENKKEHKPKTFWPGARVLEVIIICQLEIWRICIFNVADWNSWTISENIFF